MKYLKTYEFHGTKSEINGHEKNWSNLLIGDYVICINDNWVKEYLKIGKKYKVTAILDLLVYPEKIIEVADENDVIGEFSRKRFVPELEYDINKYNL